MKTVTTNRDLLMLVAQGSAGFDLPAEFESAQLSHLRYVDGRVVDVSSETSFWIDEGGQKHVVQVDGWQQLNCSIDDPLIHTSNGWKISTPDEQLAAVKAVKNSEINVARAVANTSTFEHGGKTFTCDQLSRSDIDGVNGYAALYGALPPSFPGAWKAVDNTYLPIADVEAWKAFYASMVTTGAANFVHAQTLKAQLAAATTPEAVAAIVW